jgi:hypothetical protein
MHRIVIACFLASAGYASALRPRLPPQRSSTTTTTTTGNARSTFALTDLSSSFTRALAAKTAQAPSLSSRANAARRAAPTPKTPPATTATTVPAAFWSALRALPSPPSPPLAAPVPVEAREPPAFFNPFRPMDAQSAAPTPAPSPAKASGGGLGDLKLPKLPSLDSLSTPPQELRLPDMSLSSLSNAPQQLKLPVVSLPSSLPSLSLEVLGKLPLNSVRSSGASTGGAATEEDDGASESPSSESTPPVPVVVDPPEESAPPPAASQSVAAPVDTALRPIFSQVEELRGEVEARVERTRRLVDAAQKLASIPVKAVAAAGKAAEEVLDSIELDTPLATPAPRQPERAAEPEPSQSTAPEGSVADFVAAANVAVGGPGDEEPGFSSQLARDLSDPNPDGIEVDALREDLPLDRVADASLASAIQSQLARVALKSGSA